MTGRRASGWVGLWLHARLFAFEFAAAAAAAAVLAVAAEVIRAHILEVAPSTACLRAWLLAEPMAGCGDVSEYVRRSGEGAERVMGAFGVVPLLVAGLLGAVAGARDLDEGAAPLAWGLYASRARWLAERVLVVGAVVAAVSVVSMAAAGRLADARLLVAPVGETFRDYGLLSWPLLSRSLLVFAAGLVLGLVTGRQLPALLLASGVAVALPLALAQAMPLGEPLSAVNSPQHQATDESKLGLDFSAGYQMWQDAQGGLHTEAEALAMAPSPHDYRASLDWLWQTMREVDFVIPGPRRGAVEAREAAALGFGTAAIGLAAVGITRRRRPF